MIGLPGVPLSAAAQIPAGAQELEALLAESPEAAGRRVLSQALPPEAALVLYGAGNLGMTVARRLRQAGAPAAAFADDTPGKQGLVIEGLPVLSPQAALDKFGAATVFVVTIHNPAASFVRVRERLLEIPDARVISFLALAWTYPKVFLPYLAFELPQYVLAKAPDIRRAFALLADAESRRQFVAHLKFRLWLDFDALPPSSQGDYLPNDIFGLLAADTTFVDCGAFDGDTIRFFLGRQRGRFGRILAFEPDAGNYQRLCAYVAGLDEPVRRRIVTSCAGVGSRRQQLAFNATGNTGAALSDAGTTQVDVVPLHEAIPGDSAPLFIKIDVEGAESEALAGAAPVIRDRHPVLAVSIYHRPDDLWQLPFALHLLDPASQIFVRTLGEDGMDIVCFAVPRGYS
ncbi:MAG: methyltransferase FkbM family [Bradyrhizobium sp.]|nr:methyltransferase FkbM family [Bradyrhizobium sp.]